MKVNVFGVLALLVLTACSMSNAETFKEGTDYVKLSSPVKTDDPTQIEVREFFWFGCPHCYQLEPVIQKWKQTLPEGVKFVATPSPLNKSWAVHAHAFYVAEAIGKLDQIHRDLFHAIHAEKKRSQLSTQEGLASFFTQYGISEDEFNKLYQSFSVRVKVRNAEALGKAYRLTGVPAIVVNGKYVVQPSMAKSFERMMQIVDFLIEKEKIMTQASASASQ